LGEDLGVITTPAAKFGQLNFEIWRAIRLVVDSGIHAKGWSRDKAIEFFAANSAVPSHFIEVEVDRYISWPGQALAYKVGELTLQKLKARAREELQDRFDVRTFHDVVLGGGEMPLPELEKRVESWLEDEKRVRRPSSVQ
jgi:uncharacterized protein (DUF885 family)